MGKKCLRRDFTSVAPVVSGRRDDDVQDRTQVRLQRDAQEKRLGLFGEVQCGGTDKQKQTQKQNSKRQQYRQKSQTASSTMYNDNDDVDDNDDFDDDE